MSHRPHIKTCARNAITLCLILTSARGFDCIICFLFSLQAQKNGKYILFIYYEVWESVLKKLLKLNEWQKTNSITVGQLF